MENILYNLESVCLFTKWCIHKFKRPVYQIKSHTAIHTHLLTHKYTHVCKQCLDTFYIFGMCQFLFKIFRKYTTIQIQASTFSNLSLDNENANFFFMSNKQMLTYCNCQNHFYRILKQVKNYLRYPKMCRYYSIRYCNVKRVIP